MAAAQLSRRLGEGLGAEKRPSTSAERPKPVLSDAAGGVEGLGTNGEVTRRALLGTALGVPLVSGAEAAGARGPLHQPPPSAPTGPPPRPGEEWARALAAFHAAQQEVHRIEAATAGASMEEEEEHLPAHDSACAAMEDALDQLLTAPAPTLGALAAKLELLFAHAIEPGAVDEDVATALRADSGRLLIAAA